MRLTMDATIIDYGMGNVISIQNLLKRINYDSIITSNKNEIRKANKLILPGVGHFSNGMKHIRELDLLNTLTDKVLVDKTPILGICLGMQLFSKNSEEGHAEGLGWIEANTIRFDIHNESNRYRIPHIGWNNLHINRTSKLLEGIDETVFLYFVHSYYVKATHEQNILATTNYGEEFISAIQKDNIYGTQFHPEKSHQGGIKILKNFMEL